MIREAPILRRDDVDLKCVGMMLSVYSSYSSSLFMFLIRFSFETMNNQLL